MKTVVISMGQEYLSKRKETRDFIDNKIIEFFKIYLKYDVIPVNNFSSNKLYFQKKKTEHLLKKISVSAIVLSGGQDFGTSILRDKTEIYLIQYALEKKIPLIGICRGMQVINIFFNGTLKKIKKHVNKKNKIFNEKNKFLKAIRCFHRNGIKKLGKGLKSKYFSKDGEIEAFEGKNKKILGIMWHPERNRVFSKFDINLISKFLKKKI